MGSSLFFVRFIVPIFCYSMGSSQKWPLTSTLSSTKIYLKIPYRTRMGTIFDATGENPSARGLLAGGKNHGQPV